MIFSHSFVGFPAIFISDSAPDEGYRWSNHMSTGHPDSVGSVLYTIFSNSA